MMMKSLILISFIVCGNALTAQEIEDLESELNDEFLYYPALAASALRLIFHDCGGPKQGNKNELTTDSICDGCIELDNFAAHQGLEKRAVIPLDDIYRNHWDTKISRADFWAFSATYFIKKTFQISQYIDNHNDILPDLAYFFGRRDCATSPDVDSSKTTHKIFPSGLYGWSETYNWLHTNFGFNVQQIVAILGSHTIGMAHATDSGFGTSPWTQKWNSFDNSYYQQLLRSTWKQSNLGNGLSQWDGDLMMLNCDMSLLKNIDSAECANDAKQCPDNDITKDIVINFANNNQAFLDVYIATFIEMITIGYDKKKDLIAVYGGSLDVVWTESNNGVHYELLRNYYDLQCITFRLKESVNGLDATQTCFALDAGIAGETYDYPYAAMYNGCNSDFYWVSDESKEDEGQCRYQLHRKDGEIEKGFKDCDSMQNDCIICKYQCPGSSWCNNEENKEASWDKKKGVEYQLLANYQDLQCITFRLDETVNGEDATRTCFALDAGIAGETYDYPYGAVSNGCNSDYYWVSDDEQIKDGQCRYQFDDGKGNTDKGFKDCDSIQNDCIICKYECPGSSWCKENAAETPQWDNMNGVKYELLADYDDLQCITFRLKDSVNGLFATQTCIALGAGMAGEEYAYPYAAMYNGCNSDYYWVSDDEKEGEAQCRYQLHTKDGITEKGFKDCNSMENNCIICKYQCPGSPWCDNENKEASWDKMKGVEYQLLANYQHLQCITFRLEETVNGEDATQTCFALDAGIAGETYDYPFGAVSNGCNSDYYWVSDDEQINDGQCRYQFDDGGGNTDKGFKECDSMQNDCIICKYECPGSSWCQENAAPTAQWENMNGVKYELLADYQDLQCITFRLKESVNGLDATLSCFALNAGIAGEEYAYPLAAMHNGCNSDYYWVSDKEKEDEGQCRYQLHTESGVTEKGFKDCDSMENNCIICKYQCPGSSWCKDNKKASVEWRLADFENEGQEAMNYEPMSNKIYDPSTSISRWLLAIVGVLIILLLFNIYFMCIIYGRKREYSFVKRIDSEFSDTDNESQPINN